MLAGRQFIRVLVKYSIRGFETQELLRQLRNRTPFLYAKQRAVDNGWFKTPYGSSLSE